MKKLLLLAILFGASFTTLTFAQETTTDETTVTDTSTVWTTVQEQIKANWKEFHENFGHAGLYLKKGLTVEEKTQAKNIITTRIQSMETINLEIRTKLQNKETIDREAYKAKITEIYEWFKTSFLPFVDETKEDGFNTFIEQRIATINTNRGLRAEYRETQKVAKQEENLVQKAQKTEIMQRKQVKVGEKAEKLRGVIGKINNTFLTNFLGQIDRLSAKATTTEFKTMLADIKLLIQDKLGLLNVDEDGNVIDETTVSDETEETETTTE